MKTRKRKRNVIMVDVQSPENLKALRVAAKRDNRSAGGYIRHILAEKGVIK